MLIADRIPKIMTCYRESTIKISFCRFWTQEAPGQPKRNTPHQRDALIWPITHLLN